MTKISLHRGDNRDSLRRLIKQGVRVHSVVTDPPYGLVSIQKRFGKEGSAPAKFGTDGAFARASKGFMGSIWDGTGIERDPEFWALIWEILLPGGYVFAFSGSRTGHWQACAMEMAGFVMHPMHGWVFGCLDTETLAATPDGDKPYTELSAGDEVICYDPSTGEYSVQPILEVVEYDYSDTAYRLVGNHGEQVVSRNHRCIVERDGSEVFHFAETLEQQEVIPILEDLRGLREALRLQGCESDTKPSVLKSLQGCSALAGSRPHAPSAGSTQWPNDHQPDAVRDQCGTQTVRAWAGHKSDLVRVVPFHYVGKVWCLRVPTGSFVAVRNGVAFPTGNSGFPKAHAADKAIDKHLGVAGGKGGVRGSSGSVRNSMAGDFTGGEYHDYLPGSDEAAEWEGWAYGTQAQKPALEPIYLGQKPFSEKTGAANLLKHGVGAVNVDGSRVPTDETITATRNIALGSSGSGVFGAADKPGVYQQQPGGRHPANLILDGSPEVVAMFPDSKGQQGAVRGDEPSGVTKDIYGKFNGRVPAPVRGDSGSAARFFHQFTPDADPLFYHAKAGKSDRAGSRHPCLLPGEDVLTDKGFRAIETLSLGDLVLADDGTFRPVVDHFSKPADTKSYEFHVQGSNASTTATDNHPFLVHRPGSKKRPFAKTNVSWLRADEIKVGDYMLRPVPVSSDVTGTEDYEWWFLLGFWIAEGCKLSGSNGSAYPSFTVAKKRNSDILFRIERKWSSVSKYDRGGAWQTVVFQSGLIDRYITLAGYGARGKFIGAEILAQPRWARQAVLDGYLRGDGCVVRGQHRASTASDDLAATLPLLASSVERNCSVYRHDCTGKNGTIDGRVIPGGVVHKMYFSKVTRVVFDGVIFDLARVKKVVERDYVGPVWNITVADRHTFQTRVGMSHNTVKPIALMQYLIRHITPPGGTVLDPFAGSGTTAEAAKREGFDCILMEAEPEYIEFLDGRFNLRRSTDLTDLLS